MRNEAARNSFSDRKNSSLSSQSHVCEEKSRKPPIGPGPEKLLLLFAMLLLDIVKIYWSGVRDKMSMNLPKYVLASHGEAHKKRIFIFFLGS
jgi:hypothetical protein